MTISGSDFVASIWNTPLGSARGDAIYRAFVSSYRDVPLFDVPLPGGRGYFQVCEDYAAVGTADDFVRVPMDAPTAQRVANHLGMLLPTTKMVDLIWKAATVRPKPKSMDPIAAMIGVPYFTEHNKLVQAQIDALKKQGKTGLQAGHKKDVVITNRTANQPGRVAIYGWHRENGSPIQSLSLVHEDFYADYSHGARFVHPIVHIDGVAYPLEQALTDDRHWPLLSTEKMSFSTTRLIMAYVPRVMAKLPEAKKPSIPEEIAKTGGPAAAEKMVTQGDMVGIRFVQAMNYKPVPSRNVRLIVLHTMEAPEKGNTAESVASYFATQPKGGVGGNGGSSAHYNVDNDSIVQSVREKDVAYHAPGANNDGIGIEHAGYAKQSPDDWQDQFSQDMLTRSAELASNICLRHKIPVRFLDEKALLAGEKGITTHNVVSKAFKKSTHYDPGANFPMDRYLKMISDFMDPYA